MAPLPLLHAHPSTGRLAGRQSDVLCWVGMMMMMMMLRVIIRASARPLFLTSPPAAFYLLATGSGPTARYLVDRQTVSGRPGLALRCELYCRAIAASGAPDPALSAQQSAAAAPSEWGRKLWW